MQGSNWISVFTVLILVTLFGILPVYRRNESYFGVRVSPSLYASRDGKRYFHRWCFSLGLFTVVIFAVLYLEILGSLTIVWFNVSITAFIITQALLYAHSYTRLKEHEILTDIESPRTAASLEVRKLRNFLNHWIELTAVFLIILPVILLILNYGSIPNSLPIHWNFRGITDGMVDKSIANVFSPIGIALAIYLITLVFSGFVVKAKITLPDKNTAEYHQLKLNQLNIFLRIVDLVKLLVVTEMGATAMVPLIYRMGQESTIRVYMTGINATLVIVLVMGVSLLLIKNSKINTQLKTLAGTVNIGYRGEAKHWKWGIFYVNPHDPAIWVEKRDGLGYTVNLGSSAGKWILGVIIFILLAIVLVINL